MTRGRFLARSVLVTAMLLLSACAPTMPDYPVPTRSVWLDQGWMPDQRTWYHGADQGTSTFGVPYEWFVALEQPTLSAGEAPLLSDKAYMNRFGFIPGDSRLPVGFAHGAEYRDSGLTVMTNPATGQKLTTIGLTCAACHTGRMTYQGTELLIDGGSALTDVVDFNQAFVISLLYTKYMPFRFQRFATRVLGAGASDDAKDRLRQQFDALWVQTSKVIALERSTEKQGVVEGFGRLDALNRIGNRVFGVDAGIDSNYVPRTGPVHYPHIWDAPWFTWVQYNGSIMQPMVRNAGEALGVGAAVDLRSDDGNLFGSTVQVSNLYAMEENLAGKPPYASAAFSGLRSPGWPSFLPPVDTRLADKGAVLYKEYCQGCHLPPPNTAAFWRGKWWTQIDGKGERYLDLNQIPIEEIGTDPEQARGMALRTITLPSNLSQLPPSTKFNSTKFGDALGQMVQNVTNRWFDTQTPPTSAKERTIMDGERPNLLQVKLEYKARPLNGVWATPPYLHNGSVPSLYALLSPASERPALVYLGNREFDPRDVGYRNEPIPGGFTLDTSLEGNRNTGHEFRDGPKGVGVIGPGLSVEDRRALIEFLKTL